LNNVALKNKVIQIRSDAFGLGDNIAWIPYAEEFRKKHQCVVLVSTFFNDLFIDQYPELIFVNPNNPIHNTHETFYLGVEVDNKEKTMGT